MTTTRRSGFSWSCTSANTVSKIACLSVYKISIWFTHTLNSLRTEGHYRGLSQKGILNETSTCRDGALKNQLKDGNDTTALHTILYLVPFCQLCFVFFGCAHRRTVKAVGWVCSAGWCAWRASYVAGGCNLISMSMVDMVCVVWRRFGVHGSADPVWHIGVLVAVGVKLKFTFCFLFYGHSMVWNVPFLQNFPFLCKCDWWFSNL